jgi:prepilin-type processing-associated H-X9-DG protein
MKVIGPYIEENKYAFACPSDEVYFPKEGLSYEYRRSKLANKTRQEVRKGPNGLSNSSHVFIMYDFESVHGPVGDEGSRSYLYLDGHVSE